jgi:5-methylcytosine-specific restriction protein B
MDPFTFFGYIYKYGTDKRLAILQNLANELDLPVPADTNGVPSVNAQKVWLFPWQYERNNNEIDTLWKLFYAAIEGRITEEHFSNVKAIHNVGYAKLTEGLFNVKPDSYLPINGRTRPFLKKILDISPQFTSWAEYQSVLEEVKTQYPEPFYQISCEAAGFVQSV